MELVASMRARHICNDPTLENTGKGTAREKGIDNNLFSHVQRDIDTLDCVVQRVYAGSSRLTINCIMIRIVRCHGEPSTGLELASYSKSVRKCALPHTATSKNCVTYLFISP